MAIGTCAVVMSSVGLLLDERDGDWQDSGHAAGGQISWGLDEEEAELWAKYQHGLGLAYQYLREWEKALGYFEEAVRLNPEHV